MGWMALMSSVITKEGLISELIINRPEKHNALDMDTLNELYSSLQSLSSNPESKAIIISGSGGKAFSAGADINYLASINTKEKALEMFNAFLNVTNTIIHSNKIIIAAISGYCFGGGCEIASACDFRFASKESKFAQPEIKLGIIPGGGATYRLKHIVGTQNARRLIFTGNTIDSLTAKSMGLLDEAVDSDVIEYSRNFAMQFENTTALSFAKKAINSQIDYDSSSERELFAESLLTEEAKSQIRKFLDKNKK